MVPTLQSPSLHSFTFSCTYFLAHCLSPHQPGRCLTLWLCLNGHLLCPQSLAYSRYSIPLFNKLVHQLSVSMVQLDLTTSGDPGTLWMLQPRVQGRRDLAFA